VRGTGLAITNGGTEMQPYANGIIVLTTDKPQSWLTVYDNARKAKAER